MSEEINIKSGQVHWTASEGLHVKVPQATWEDFGARIGGILVTADHLRVEGLRTPEGEKQQTRLVATALYARGVRVQGEGFDVGMASLALHKGFRVKRDGEFLCPAVAAEELTFDFNLRPTSVPVQTKSSPKPLSWTFLDVLEGHLNLDLAVDMTGPLIGRRRETHEFRVPISGGSIDYDELEDDVNWLERSFIDIQVANKRLILARDLPLLPFSKKAILWWPLDTTEEALARKRRIKLRTLLGWEIPPVERSRREHKSSIRLNSITARGIDASIGFREPIEIDLGAAGRVKLRAARPGDKAELRISGDVHQHDEAGRTSQLSGVVLQLVASLNSVVIHDQHVSVEDMRVDHNMPIEVRLEGRRLADVNGTVDITTGPLRLAPARAEANQGSQNR